MTGKSKPAAAPGFYSFDLLGDPVSENHGKRGRPPHCKTTENQTKVVLLLAVGWSRSAIARALRITKATLQKHYSRELSARDEATEALVAAHHMAVFKAAMSGNVGAMKQLGQLIEKHGLDGLIDREGEEQPAQIKSAQLPAPWSGRTAQLGNSTVAGSA